MSQYDSAIIIGCGNMGSSYAKSFQNQGVQVNHIVDPDTDVDNLASKLEANRYDKIENIDGSLTDKVWYIATPVGQHKQYLKHAMRIGVENVLVEKPITESPIITERFDFSNSAVSVDFIELEHPVVRKILDDISQSHFRLGSAIHWRGKKSSGIHAYMRNDLVHDLSEIFELYNTLGYNRNKVDINEVSNVKDWSDVNRFSSSDKRNIYDSQGTVYLTGGNNEPIYLTGGFNQSSERRYFLWTDKSQDTAYFGMTVNRQHLTPVAVRINGYRNVQFAVQKCLDGTLRDDKEISDFISQINGTVIKKGSTVKNGKSRIESICSKISDGEVAPASVRMSIDIDWIIYEIYQRQNSVPAEKIYAESDIR